MHGSRWLGTFKQGVEGNGAIGHSWSYYQIWRVQKGGGYILKNMEAYYSHLAGV